MSALCLFAIEYTAKLAKLVGLASRGSDKWHSLNGFSRSYSACMFADGHRPIYTTSVGDSVVSVAQDLRNALEPLLLKYQVDTPP